MVGRIIKPLRIPEDHCRYRVQRRRKEAAGLVNGSTEVTEEDIIKVNSAITDLPSHSLIQDEAEESEKSGSEYSSVGNVVSSQISGRSNQFPSNPVPFYHQFHHKIALDFLLQALPTKTKARSASLALLSKLLHWTARGERVKRGRGRRRTFIASVTYSLSVQGRYTLKR